MEVKLGGHTENFRDSLERLSLIDEHHEKFVRMANLASAGSHAHQKPIGITQ